MTASEPAPGGPNRTSAVRPLAALSGRGLSPLVYDNIKERLLEGVYAAGERLPVEQLKAEFEVSKQPIMDALRRLASEGLLEIVPQSGTRVPIYSPQDVADFFAMFGGMEGAVAGVAAQRAQEDQLAELQRTNDDIGSLTRQPDPAARSHGYRVLNRKFHTIINTMAHSPAIADISRRMWDISDLLINTSGIPQPLADAIDDRFHDHDRIIEALLAGNSETARAEMEAHILGTVDIIHAGPTAI